MMTILSDTNDVIKRSSNPMSNQYHHDMRGQAALPSFTDGVLKNLETQIQQNSNLKEQINNMQQQIRDMSQKAEEDMMKKVREIEEMNRSHLFQVSKMEDEKKEALITMRSQWDEDARQRGAAHNSEKLLLQGELLAPIAGFTPLTDSECQRSMNDFRRKIHTLAFGIAGYDATKLGITFNQVDFIRRVDKRYEKLVLESYIWLVIMDMVFSTPFKVFGEYGDTFALAWTSLFAPSKPSP
jgi:predicted DNA binding CopG/RHH family protein